MKRTMDKMSRINKEIKKVIRGRVNEYEDDGEEFSDNDNNNNNNNIIIERSNLFGEDNDNKKSKEITNLKVLVNGVHEFALYVGEYIDKNKLSYNDIKSKRAFAYHQLCYEPKSNCYKSTDTLNTNSNDRILSKDYLYTHNSEYIVEDEWEMCYLRSVGDLLESTFIWSWEFDSKFDITQCILNLFYITFGNNDTFKLYIGKEINNSIIDSQNNDKIKKYIKEQFYLLPIRKSNGITIFDKKMDITEYLKDSNKLYIAIIMSGRTQIFRSKTSMYRDEYPYNVNPNPYQFQYQFPFNINFQVSPIQQPQVTTTSTTTTTTTNKNKENEYYFIEENIGLKYIHKLKLSKIKEWDNERVLNWLFDLSLFQLIDPFKEQGIDGQKILTMNLNSLPTNIESNLSHKQKKRFLKSLNSLINLNGSKIDPHNDSKRITSSNILVLKKKQPINNNNNDNNNNNNNNEKEAELINIKKNKKKERLLLLLNDEKSDYKLMIEDKVLNVHKEILSNNSEYFDAMLTSSFSENLNSKSCFDVDQFLNYSSLQSVMELVYLNEKPLKIEFLKLLSLDQLKSTIILCDRFLFSKLKELVENFIIWSINSDNLTTIHTLFNFNPNISNFTSFSLKYLK